ncbi:MAG: hypothetical protein ACT4OX_10965 [Actinomycetota bacterium]
MPATGRWPVILGPPDDMELTFETALVNSENGASATADLQAAHALDVERWLATRANTLEITADELEGSGTRTLCPHRSRPATAIVGP